MKYRLVYKCPLCNMNICSDTVLDISAEEAVSFINKCVQNQAFAGNPYLHKANMNAIHKCEDGNIALATLGGLVRVEEPTSDSTGFLNKLISLIS